MRKHLKRAAALCAAIVLVAALGAMPAAADSGVPQAVLDARDGVVRVIGSDFFGASTGSGFLVGTGDKIFIATNHHVVEDVEDLYVLYGGGKYVTASIYYDDPARDICILKPDRAIPRGKVLPLENDDFESGLAVYALGFPAAADYFSSDVGDYYLTVEELLESVVADKDKMTITNGIVSAIHDSTLIGDGSRSVRLVQTNTAINGGNSGGPLLDGNGRVVGINTMGITIAEAMNGSVHVDELMRVLDKAKIDYETTPNSGLDGGEKGGMMQDPRFWGILIFLGVVLVGGGVAIVLVLAKQRKMPVKGGVTLQQFERSYRKVEDVATLEMGIRFVRDLLPLAGYDLTPLLTPQNVVIGDNAIALWQKGVKGRAGPPVVHPGFTAPEVAQGQVGQASSVYFVGAVLYTMLTGHRPQNADQRLAANQPVFTGGGALQTLVNQAVEPYVQNRIQTLYDLAQMLEQIRPAVNAEASQRF